MPKSVKFSNDNYLDTSSIIHKYSNNYRECLKDFLDLRKTLDSKLMVRQSSPSITYNNGAYIGWNEEVFNNSNGLLVNSGGGLITVNYTGYIKISFGLWVNGTTTTRPWACLVNYSTSTTIIDIINDSSAGYVSLSASNIIIPVSSGQKFGISVNSSTSTFNINAGSGRGAGTYMEIEIIK